MLKLRNNVKARAWAGKHVHNETERKGKGGKGRVGEEEQM